ncbi:hypothetical protein KIN20_012853 [Parelaphostrongylus tenuis]|uniref:Uncharacterized protein n=1 Tax=Parelaphostrongylus tenuis TaxID=148309 RepID=A0AAD5MWS9_PARTN|nr:hypothetical protein KIN20_012853 [Parelaphostrongylus tenuis]
MVMCTPTILTITTIFPHHLSVSGTLSEKKSVQTTNIIVANWSRQMSQNVVNRAFECRPLVHFDRASLSICHCSPELKFNCTKLSKTLSRSKLETKTTSRNTCTRGQSTNTGHRNGSAPLLFTKQAKQGARSAEEVCNEGAILCSAFGRQPLEKQSGSRSLLPQGASATSALLSMPSRTRSNIRPSIGRPRYAAEPLKPLFHKRSTFRAP